MTKLATLGLTLDPLDVLFFRDGRPFAAATRAAGGLPTPQTLWGALTTALLERRGCDFRKLAAEVRSGNDWPGAVVKACDDEASRWIAALRVRGPWLARRSAAHAPAAGAPLEIFTPAPATLYAPKDKTAARQLSVVAPLPAGESLPGWHESSGASGTRPLWPLKPSSEPSARAQGFLTSSGLRAFLRGDTVENGALVESGELYQDENRTGIEIDADRLTAKESQIYGARFLSLAPGVVFYAEVAFPVDAPTEPLAGIERIAWGGEGRRVRVERVPRHDWQIELRAGERPFLLLTTPGLFEDGPRPACLNGRLVAAAAPEPIAVSGWDLALGGPKPNRFAAPAGSVYFLDSLPEPLPDSLCDDPLDCQKGWGCFFQGAWTDA
jgi:CRISPR-associated protein Cmr3